MQTAVDWDAIETPLELARALWTPEGRSLSPKRFKELFDRVYSSTGELEPLWQLGGASNDYLRFHPEAIDVPSKLPRTLLRSDDVEARVIGLKLLGRCHAQPEEIIEEIVGALKTANTYEVSGGLFEVGELLEKVTAGKCVLTARSYAHLSITLQSLLGHEDSYARETASHHSDWLADFRQRN